MNFNPGDTVLAQAYAFYTTYPPPATGTATLSLVISQDGEVFYTNTVSYTTGPSEPTTITTSFTVARGSNYTISASTSYTPATPTPTPTNTPTKTPTQTPTRTLTPTPTGNLPYSYTINYDIYDCPDGCGYRGGTSAGEACGFTNGLTVYSNTTPFQNGMTLYLDSKGSFTLPAEFFIEVVSPATGSYLAYNGQSFLYDFINDQVTSLTSCDVTVDLYHAFGAASAPSSVDIYYSLNNSTWTFLASHGPTTSCTSLFGPTVPINSTVYIRVERADLVTDVYFTANNSTGGSCPGNSATTCNYSFVASSNMALNITTYVNAMFGTFLDC